MAFDLAKACQAELHLLMVVPTVPTLLREEAATAKLLPGATAALLNMTEQKAKEELGELVAQLKTTWPAVTAEIGRGDPTKLIAQTARRVKADLIVETR